MAWAKQGECKITQSFPVKEILIENYRRYKSTVDEMIGKWVQIKIRIE